MKCLERLARADGEDTLTVSVTMQLNQEQFMQFRLFPSAILGLSLVVASAAFCGIVEANGFQKTGAHGGSVNATTTQNGNKLMGGVTAAGANGKTATATGTATVLPGKVTASGTVTGPNGGTATGSASASNGTVNASGTATGKNGQSRSGSVTATAGTASLTSGTGKSKTVTKPASSSGT